MKTETVADHLTAARKLAEEGKLSIIVYLVDVALKALHSGRGGGKFGEVLSSKSRPETDFNWPKSRAS